MRGIDGRLSLRMPGGEGIVVGRAGNLARELFQGLPLRLWDQDGGEDTAEHEKSEDLHDVVEPWRLCGSGGVGCSAAGAKRTKDDLSDDGADLAGCGGDTVGC